MGSNGMIQPQALYQKLVNDPNYAGRQFAKLHRRWFKTYRDLVKALPEMLTESHDNEIHVARSRRGQGGEWFEIWQPGPKGPTKIREGWQ